jgi:uncharacterized protein (DUF924 family)
MAAQIVASQNLLDFWFIESARSHWFSVTPELDTEIARRLGRLHDDEIFRNCSGSESG